MMRLALISDLHANELALEAVLADARGAGYDQVALDAGALASRIDGWDKPLAAPLRASYVT